MSDMKMAISILKKIGIAKLMKIDKGGDANFVIYPYVNGREVGFAIIREAVGLNWKDLKTVVFSEHRSSDYTVVYIGRHSEFDTKSLNPSYVPNDRAYQDKIMFASGKVDDAADFIKKELGL